MKAWLRLWFGFQMPVGRRAYALSGFALMALKYGVDAAAVYWATDRFWWPWSYFQPLISARMNYLDSLPAWLIACLFLWMLPFLWIGASMTIRRSIDAGLSPWFGLAFFVPAVNYLVLLILCVVPQRPPSQAPLLRTPSQTAAVAPAAGIGAFLGLAVALLGVELAESYGAALFLGAPFLVGLTSAYLYNRHGDRSVSGSLGVASLSLAVAFGCLLLLALEGLVCIAMTVPIALPITLVGALFGRSLASVFRAESVQVSLWFLALPLLFGAEALAPTPPLREVVTTVEIDATPEEVWDYVIHFPPLPAPTDLWFRLGVAFPQKARIEGTGVGAVRYCEFSTGPFVEPITIWEPPHRLAFDVSSQPDPMQELSPYRNLRPPHLAEGLISRRGEFRLVPLPGGRTRLEGSTWYTLKFEPIPYWGLWSDAIIHRIHGRVLDHIRDLAEADGSTAKPS
ncbi:MAG: SRPBCC family protein [Deltaproteobacteria bacterium]|nr:SRPBCC family protein [Deltaproteobacteria bacterium]